MSGILGGNLVDISVISLSLTPASVNGTSSAEQTFTCPGIRVGDVCYVTPPGVTSGVSIAMARPTAADTIGITFDNPTGGALTPPSGTYRVLWARPDNADAGAQT